MNSGTRSVVGVCLLVGIFGSLWAWNDRVHQRHLQDLAEEEALVAAQEDAASAAKLREAEARAVELMADLDARGRAKFQAMLAAEERNRSARERFVQSMELEQAISRGVENGLAAHESTVRSDPSRH